MTLNITDADRVAFNTALDRLCRKDYVHNPVGWVQDVLHEYAWSIQASILTTTSTDRLVAVQSAHGIGKSRLASWLALWFLATRPSDDTVVVTSAPTSHQVSAVLWRYIRQGHATAKLDGYITQGQVPEWKIDGNLVGFGRKPADHQKSAFQGLHAGHLLVILDEACGVPKWLWDAADSLITGAKDQHLLAIGNPDDAGSHFATVCTTEPGWTRFKVSAFDTPAFTGETVPQSVLDGLVSQAWVADKQLRWGESNPLYKAKVLGEFVDAEDSLIPMSWVMQAQQRWNTWHENGEPTQPGRHLIGVDVARYGDDSTVLAIRQGDVICRLERYVKQDTVDTTAKIEQSLGDVPGATAIVDDIGVGGGVVDLLRHHGRNVHPFTASARTKYRDVTGLYKFLNMRSAAWWSMRERLDPSKQPTVCLPPDEELAAELCAPRWEIRAGGVLSVESKDDIRKRLGRSTDSADAVLMAFFTEPTPELDELGRMKHQNRVRRHVDAVSWNL